MSYADKVFNNMCRDIIDNGTDTRGEKVRPVWEDGTPAYTIKKFGVVNRYDLSKEFPALTLRRTAITARTTAISTYNGVSFSARFFVSVTIADIPLKKHCFPASLRISPIASIVPSEEVPSSKKIAIIVPVSELNTS